MNQPPLDESAIRAVKEMRDRAYRQGWQDAMKALRRIALENSYNSPMFGGTTGELEKIGVSKISEWERDAEGNLTRTIG